MGNRATPECDWLDCKKPRGENSGFCEEHAGDFENGPMCRRCKASVNVLAEREPWTPGERVLCDPCAQDIAAGLWSVVAELELNGWPMLIDGICGRVLAGDHDKRSLVTALRIVVERVNEARDMLVAPLRHGGTHG